MNDTERRYKEYLLYCYELASHKYADHPDTEALIQDTVMALVEREWRGEAVESPKGFLSAVMKNLYNGWLRQKYRDRIVYFGTDADEGFDSTDGGNDEADGKNGRDKEYAAVRRELGRLVRIYREVAVRHYIDGESVEKIAHDLGIPVGTVKSRLSGARSRIKEGIKKMEKYDRISYEPKTVSVGIWGSDSYKGEPFSLLNSKIEGNILIAAYEKPISAVGIADAMGIPTAYIEPLADRLVAGELMGRTDGGLYYTRCFIRKHSDEFGNIAAQESLADRFAADVWETVMRSTQPLWERPEFAAMTDKQKATLLLFFMSEILTELTVSPSINPDARNTQPPERPNGGRWLATATVFETDEKLGKYDSSGPCHINLSDGVANVSDYQSAFGDTHWVYDRLDTVAKIEEVARFYVSFLVDGVKPHNAALYENAGFFEELHILRRDANGKAVLDIPYMTFDEWFVHWQPAEETAKAALRPLLCGELAQLADKHRNRVPKHVDAYKYYEHVGALGAYEKAQLFAISEKNLMPWHVEIGKTPIIFIRYKK